MTSCSVGWPAGNLASFCPLQYRCATCCYYYQAWR